MAYLDVFGRGVVALRPYGGYGKEEYAVASGDGGAVAVGLFWESFVKFNGNVVVAR